MKIDSCLNLVHDSETTDIFILQALCLGIFCSNLKQAKKQGTNFRGVFVGQVRSVYRFRVQITFIAQSSPWDLQHERKCACLQMLLPGIAAVLTAPAGSWAVPSWAKESAGLPLQSAATDPCRESFKPPAPAPGVLLEMSGTIQQKS